MSEKGTPSPAQGSPPSLRISDAAMTIYPCDGRQACVDRSVCSLPAWNSANINQSMPIEMLLLKHFGHHGDYKLCQ
jgi:hypothetical protein